MIILILILSFIVRLINLNQSLWLDESIEILAAKNISIFKLLTQYAIGDFHPPLYHLLLKFWGSIFGWSEISMRLPSVFFGILTVYFVYLIGKKLFGGKYGLASATVMAVSPLAVYYSQEARMYSLATVAVTASVYFFLKKNWMAYFFCFTIALYTDYLPYLMIPLFLYWSKSNRKLLIAHCLLLILSLPLAPLFLKQFSVGTSTASSLPLWSKVVGNFNFLSLPLTIVKFIIGRISIDNNLIYLAIISPVVLFYSWLIISVREKTLWLWFLFPLLLGFFISAFIPIFSYFRFLFVLPAFTLLVSAGAYKKGKFYLLAVLIISFVCLATFNITPDFHREDWRSAVAYINSDPGTVLIPSLAQAAPLNYYDSNLTVQDLSTMNIGYSTPVYYFQYVQEIFDPQNIIQKSLKPKGYVQVEEKRFSGLVVYKYSL